MVSILIVIRDALIALALAWVGVTVETRVSAERCADDVCAARHDN